MCPVIGLAGSDLLMAVEVYKLKVVHVIASLWVNVVLLEFLIIEEFISTA